MFKNNKLKIVDKMACNWYNDSYSSMDSKVTFALRIEVKILFCYPETKWKDNKKDCNGKPARTPNVNKLWILDLNCVTLSGFELKLLYFSL